jgi:flavin reductase (DIM6/NTAB) family NADH-FMN oxidoreductase RutF
LAEDASLDYRRALGAFATGVCVVVAEDEAANPSQDSGAAVGLTVNSFVSISLEPRLVLWSLGDDCDRRHLFSAAQRFTINILAAEELELCERFAWGDARLAPAEVERTPGGMAGLKGALTTLECEAREHVRLGDHLAIVSEVLGYATRAGDGLLFFRGGYGRAELAD